MKETVKPQNKESRTLRVFEAFAGIGAQASALERLKIKHEIVGISEWSIDAIICYDAIHRKNNESVKLPDKKEQVKYLERFQFSKDSVRPTKLKSLSNNEIEQLYIANKRSKNYGSITQLHGSN